MPVIRQKLELMPSRTCLAMVWAVRGLWTYTSHYTWSWAADVAISQLPASMCTAALQLSCIHHLPCLTRQVTHQHPSAWTSSLLHVSAACSPKGFALFYCQAVGLLAGIFGITSNWGRSVSQYLWRHQLPLSFYSLVHNMSSPLVKGLGLSVLRGEGVPSVKETLDVFGTCRSLRLLPNMASFMLRVAGLMTGCDVAEHAPAAHHAGCAGRTWPCRIS